MMSYDLNNIGEYICNLKLKKGFTQQQLAEFLHVSNPAVSQWENGKGIKTEYLYELSKIFDVSVAELIEGKSKYETVEEYINRNFNIEKYDFDGPIDQNSLEQLDSFYRHIQLVRSCFYQLLLRWASDNLSEEEKEKFLYVKKYFTFDNKYGAYLMGENILFCLNEEKIKQLIQDKMTELKNSSKEEQEWELSKFYYLNYDIKGKEVHESHNLKALELYLSILTMPEKDALLNNNLKIEETITIEHNKMAYLGNSTKTQIRERTIEEIENIPFFKVMLNSGCQCVFEYDSHIHPLEDEDLEYLEGNIQNISLRAVEDFNQPLFFNYEPYRIWKTLTLKEYRECLDNKKTAYLKAVVNLRENEPLKYYQKMIEYFENEY